MSLKNLDNLTSTLYWMPSLSSIAEDVDEMFDPFSLVNYEELDDYIMSLKARHKPDSRISVPSVTRIKNCDSRKYGDFLKPWSPMQIQQSSSITEFSVGTSNQVSPKYLKSPEFSN